MDSGLNIITERGDLAKFTKSFYEMLAVPITDM
jgi:hypothetical protein